MKADAGPASQWPAILTWRSHDSTRIESARVHLTGNRIKAVGRIVAAQSENNPAFSASYDLITDDSGATKRLSQCAATHQHVCTVYSLYIKKNFTGAQHS